MDLTTSHRPNSAANERPRRPLAALPWQSRLVERLPGDPERRNFTRPVHDVAFSETQPTTVARPELLAWSTALADELGIVKPARSATPGDQGDPSVRILGGNHLAPGMRPYAARYGGHQFGQWVGQLGDGRALTLGEAPDASGRSREFQLKGAGPTPYSRRGDGRAVLRSSIREFLCSEAMHFLGVPTTRALSLVGTGETVVRDMFYDGRPAEEPGAIVCRVSPSFVRFGNFEILARTGELPLLRQLTELVIDDHYPELRAQHGAGEPALFAALLDEVARRTAVMIAHWMRVGFVHGVMNTDNMSILGLTIDYGPYGWLEPYDPDWTPNTTDAQGRRYRFGHQPDVALWNLLRLAEALLPLVESEDRCYQSLDLYRSTFKGQNEAMLAAKLGLTAFDATDEGLTQEMFGLMRRSEADYTLFFRALSDWAPEDLHADAIGEDLWRLIAPTFYADDGLVDEVHAEWRAWADRYAARLARYGRSFKERSTAMKAVNPKYVLRNYLAQNAIKAATIGDLSVLERLQRVLERPYEDQPGEDDLAVKRPDWAKNAPGCSALSCSS